ncbi:DUF1896 family protein [Mucilaginibacter litoreus]|uniref:DUF1896 family protein n=1 Tax=Mucilaginibacter litoreus TaxID=1048221 RepID=A0ABW3AY40_9SPHI
MKEHLINKLHHFLMDNHLDLLIALQEEHRLTHYLRHKVDSVMEICEELQAENRPEYVIEALCMEELTRDLRPSRYEYIRALLEEEFKSEFERMAASGILTYEIISLIGACEPIFEVFAFGEEGEDGRELRSAITAMITEYFER